MLRFRYISVRAQWVHGVKHLVHVNDGETHSTSRPLKWSYGELSLSSKDSILDSLVHKLFYTFKGTRQVQDGLHFLSVRCNIFKALTTPADEYPF